MINGQIILVTATAGIRASEVSSISAEPETDQLPNEYEWHHSKMAEMDCANEFIRGN